MKNLQKAINDARLVIENISAEFDPCVLSFKKEKTYVIKGEALSIIAKALYLTDCEIDEREDN